MYLLDTNVLSELRKVPVGRADIHVQRWAESVATTTLFLSVITVFELETQILLLAQRDRPQGNMLRTWLEDQVLPAFQSRILPASLDIARQAARLSIPDPRPRRHSLIAATALVHRLAVVTRDVEDFLPTGVAVVNPWQTGLDPR